MSLNWVENSFPPISDCLIGKYCSFIFGTVFGDVADCQCMQWNPRLRGYLCVGFVYLCILSVPFAFSTKAVEMCAGSPKLFGFPLVELLAQRLQRDFGRSCVRAVPVPWMRGGHWPGAPGLSGGRSAAPCAPCWHRVPKQPKGGLALPLFKCKFLLVHYYHVLLQQIIKHMWLEGSTVGLFILTGCFISVLWLRAVLAAGFVPNKQHGSFVMEKWHMLGLFLTQQTSKTFRELVQTNVYCNFIAKEEKQPEKCSKKSFVQACKK